MRNIVSCRPIGLNLRDGLTVVGTRVVGFDVVGATVVGFAVVGTTVVGFDVVGTTGIQQSKSQTKTSKKHKWS